VPAPGEQIGIKGVELVIEAVEGDVVSSAVALPPAKDAP
jgi:hypothetical protein